MSDDDLEIIEAALIYACIENKGEFFIKFPEDIHPGTLMYRVEAHGIMFKYKDERVLN